MYLRETRRQNKDGTVVRYLQLAHSERHPVTGVPQARVIHNFGRADQVDREVEVGVARRQALGERERVPGFHQHVEAPALHLAALVLVPFVKKRQLIHRRIGSLSWRRFLRR